MSTPNPFMEGVAPDPLPWLTQRFRDAGVFSEDTSTVAYMAGFLGACQSIVNAMSDNAKSYVVRYSTEHGSAYTDGKKQQVVIGTKPILDPSLTDGQRAAITLALAAHEVGHVRWSVTMQTRLEAHYGDDPHRKAWAMQVWNIAHDIHLEHWQVEDFPTLEAIFALKGLYFARPWNLDLSRPQTRYGALINATLYPHATDWTSPEGAAFKEWADGWRKRCTLKSARRTKDLIALIDEALDYLRYDETPEPPPEDGPKPSGEGEESEDEDEDDDGDGSAGTGEDGFDEDDDEMRDGGSDGSGAPPEKSDGETVDGDGEDDESEVAAGDDESDDSDPADGDGSAHGGGDLESEDGDSTTADDDDSELERSIGDEGESTKEGDDAPVPSVHGDMHTTDDVGWQAAVDEWRRVQSAGRDRFVVGDGERFKYREVRISRIQR